MFYTNKIELQQGNFKDFVKKTLNPTKPTIKTASVKVAEVKKVAKKEDAQQTTDAGKVEGKLVNNPKPCGCKTKKAPAKGKADAQETTDAGKVEGKLVNKPEAKKEAAIASSTRFIKLSKLNSKQKSYFKAFWGNLFGADYAEAMCAD